MTNRLLQFLLALLCAMAAQAGFAQAAGASTGSAESGDVSTCIGRFPSPAETCWSCVLPISIGAATIAGGSQEDIPNPVTPICSCIYKPVIGVTIGFWEPVRNVELVRKPFCLPSMGGLDLSSGMPAPEHGRNKMAGGEGYANSFYQAHLYVDLLMGSLGSASPCTEKGRAGDLAWMTEFDPLWHDDSLNLILNPDAVLFANEIAVLACVADCIVASVGFGLRELFWCAGCQGGLYPMDGNVSFHMGGPRTAELLEQRLMARMHRAGLAQARHFYPGLCGPYPMPVMDKTAYKSQMIYPVPNTQKDGGRCCQPFGRTTILWAADKEIPVYGEDYVFKLFRKRNCCVGWGLNQ